MNLDIAVDMDSITYDFNSKLLRIFNPRLLEKLGRPFSLDDLSEFSFAKSTQGVVSDQEVDELIAAPGFFRDLKPLPGAREGIKLLQEVGYNVIFLSSPTGPHSAKEKMESLEEHFPFVPRRNVCLTHAKSRFKVNVLIDDHPKHLTSYKLAWPEAKVFTIDYPYNRHVPVDFRAMSCHNTWDAWTSLVEAVDEVEAGRL